MQVDISLEADVESMVARACREFGTIHILVNNAARFVFNFVTEITEEGDVISFRRSTLYACHNLPKSCPLPSMVPTS